MKTHHSLRGRVALSVATAVAAGALMTGCAVPGASDDSSVSNFRISMSDPIHLTSGNTWSYSISTMLYTAPLQIDPESGTPVSAAAQSVESDDQQHWTVTLNEGWTFHNGDPVTAQNFVDAWNATALGKNAWVQNYNFASIEGFADLNPAEGEATATEMSGLSVVSDTEFTVTLSEPYGLFPYALTSYAFAPLPKAAFDDPAAFDVKPIGNGPYKISNSYEPNEPVELTSFEGYKGSPGQTETITFVPYQSQDTAYNDLLAGNLDIVYPVPPDRLSDVEKRVDGRIAISKIPNLNYFGYPTWDSRFSDVRVRQAFSLAVDRDAIASSILKGSAAPATSIAPDTAFGTEEGACESCVYDPEKAKALLAEAGGWSGPLVLWAQQYSGNDQILQAVGNQLRNNLGIEEVTFQIDPYTQFSEAVDEQGVTGPFLSYWGAYFPHLAGFLEPIASSTGAANKNDYVNPDVQRLIAEGDSRSIDEGIPFYREAEALLWKDMPIMPLFYGQYTAAWSPKVVSVPVGVHGLGDLRTVSVHNDK